MLKRLRQLSVSRKAVIALAVIAVFGYVFCLPSRIFEESYSTVLEARRGELLSAAIAADGQWRFPEREAVPWRFEKALLAFEDQRFHLHPGVDPIALARALFHNIREGRVVSGGSTITMQVIRLSRKATSRSIAEKCIEMILATRLEWSYSKKEILALYASHAPFGGNVVGLDAACWRYFGRSAENLSWSEAALLAVLPNAPSLIHPGKNRAMLKNKRDALLDKMRLHGTIDSLTWELSKKESVPEMPTPLPRLARHLLDRIKKEGLAERRVQSTIDFSLQRRVEETLQQHHQRLKANQIYNGAVIVLEVSSGNTIAYAGNVHHADGSHGEDVDIITASRSTGSILKPFLYAAALDEGLILPASLLPDIPVMMNGFSPENFSREYDGAVPANVALIRSLNVPSVLLLKDYRYEKFYSLLQNMGMKTLMQPPDHYGLSLILGGAEASLWDVTGMYASMARTLKNYFEHPGDRRYTLSDFHAPTYLTASRQFAPSDRVAASWLSASSIWITFENLKELYRPVEQAGWKYFSTSKQIAWKTGTSFGFRDGWAIGVNGDHAVGVWVGNADGEGRPGLTGTSAAAPLLFDVFSLLSGSTWFDFPGSEMHEIAVCSKSGYRASPDCPDVHVANVTMRGLQKRACPYHKTIHLSKDARYRLHSECADVSSMMHASWFVLPPVQEYYFRSRNISYKPLPPYRSDCRASSPISSMDLVYPKPGARILLPRDFDGSPGKSVFELAHREDGISVFWHLDGHFIGVTKGQHRLAVNPEPGRHILTLVDENGETLQEPFTVISTL